LLEVTGDESDFNKTLGTRAIKWALGMSKIGRALPIDQFLDALRINFGKGETEIDIDSIRVACHHLVTYDKISGCFEFGHFSVAEFFDERKRVHGHYDEVQKEFGPDKIRSLLADACVSQMDLTGVSAFPTAPQKRLSPELTS
jgi:hypothetical protein